MIETERRVGGNWAYQSKSPRRNMAEKSRKVTEAVAWGGRPEGELAGSMEMSNNRAKR